MLAAASLRISLSSWFVILQTGDREAGHPDNAWFSRVIALSPGINPAEQWSDTQDAFSPQ
jgi:hypothetical protein